MAISTQSPGRLAVGRESTVLVASGVSVDTTTDLRQLFEAAEGDDVTGFVKNVTITPPETAYELVSLLGVDTNSFQNQLLEEKPPGMATFTATMILGEDEAFEPYLDSSSTTVTGGYTRYQMGNSQQVSGTDILVQVSGATGTVNLALIDAKLTKYGDVKISASDGHWEQEITGICLAKNFYWEYED
ncbi:MAG: hypothetical protein ACW991_00690 [Candidatus Hodarchaeales archaeon]|jgi:hypothetical protein